MLITIMDAVETLYDPFHECSENTLFAIIKLEVFGEDIPHAVLW